MASTGGIIMMDKNTTQHRDGKTLTCSTAVNYSLEPLPPGYLVIGIKPYGLEQQPTKVYQDLQGGSGANRWSQRQREAAEPTAIDVTTVLVLVVGSL